MVHRVRDLYLHSSAWSAYAMPCPARPPSLPLRSSFLPPPSSASLLGRWGESFLPERRFSFPVRVSEAERPSRKWERRCRERGHGRVEKMEESAGLWEERGELWYFADTLLMLLICFRAMPCFAAMMLRVARALYYWYILWYVFAAEGGILLRCWCATCAIRHTPLFTCFIIFHWFRHDITLPLLMFRRFSFAAADISLIFADAFAMLLRDFLDAAVDARCWCCCAATPLCCCHDISCCWCHIIEEWECRGRRGKSPPCLPALREERQRRERNVSEISNLKSEYVVIRFSPWCSYVYVFAMPCWVLCPYIVIIIITYIIILNQLLPLLYMTPVCHMLCHIPAWSGRVIDPIGLPIPMVWLSCLP